MEWQDKVPDNTGFIGNLRQGIHTWGRNRFYNSYASGGVASLMFAPSPGQAASAAWNYGKIEKGSRQHLANLEKLYQATKNPSIKEYMNKVALSGPAKRGLMGRIGGGALGAAFTIMPAFTTPGGSREKGQAVATGLASWGGWAVGSKLGMTIGTGIGSYWGPIGAGAGALTGWLVGGILGGYGADAGAGGLLGIPNRMVDRERKRRRVDWVGDTNAFRTERAATMRARSLEAMNTGMNSSRSLLGREGVFLHQ